MNTSSIPEQEPTPPQERGVKAVIEDNSLPAEQILSEQNDQDTRPTLFVP